LAKFGCAWELDAAEHVVLRACEPDPVPPSSGDRGDEDESRVVGHEVVDAFPVGRLIGRAYGKFEKFNVYKSAEGTQKTGGTACSSWPNRS